MKFYSFPLLMIFLFSATTAQAGVVIGGTRLIYEAGKKEASLSVNNSGKSPYLIQSWVESNNGSAEKASFIITPPLFRLDGEQQNVLRVVRTGSTLPSDRESLFWMNIKSIPSATNEADSNTLQIAVKTRLKLIYRPQGLTGTPEASTQKLSWKISGNTLVVSNPTPFYMNFQEIRMGGKALSGVTYVAPMSQATFTAPAGTTSRNIDWKIISDYGAVGAEHKATL